MDFALRKEPVLASCARPGRQIFFTQFTLFVRCINFPNDRSFRTGKGRGPNSCFLCQLRTEGRRGLRCALSKTVFISFGFETVTKKKKKLGGKNTF